MFILVIKTLFVNGVNKNMPEQLITVFLSENFISSVVSNIDILAGVFNKYLSGLGNVRMASIILMLLVIVMFLFLIIVLYVKSIVAFLKTENANPKKKIDVVHIDEEDDEESLAREREFERELEKELERDLEQSRIEREVQEQHERQLLDQQRELERQEQRRKEQEKEKQEEKKAAEMQNKIYTAKKEYQVDFDWKKGKLRELEEHMQDIISEDSLTYQQSNKALSELLGLIIDMIGRGVDDLKIAQTVMYRNQGQSSEDDVMQTISAIKDFIALAVNGKFAQIRKEKQLPDEATALYHLAEGDTTYSLALIEALMDSNIEKTLSMTSGPKRDEIFIETSNQACVFGTLSAISDVHLATGAFELAIELASKNINAWNRAADMYAKAGSHNQAIKAYQNVLDMADEEINIAQVANANKMLSQYYYEQGNNLQAAKLYNSSKQYYDSLGINRRLDRQELEIIEIIETRQKDELGDTINKILNSQDMQYSYA